LAHAHFDQNPFDGSYELVPRKTDKPVKERHLKAEAVRKWSIRIGKACHQIGFCEVPYIFSAVNLDGFKK
jgi:hypothetical protein